MHYPDGNVLLRHLGREYPIIERGEGPYLFDQSGKRWFDASGGALVISVGHGNREIADAMHAQLKKVGYVNGMQFTSEPTESLARTLCERAPKGLGRAFFLGSGSEAIEAAIKFARQLWVERGQPERARIIARTPGYHGNTLFALSASARAHYKKFFGPLLHDVIMIDAPYEYRPKGDAAWYAAQLERAIADHGASSIAAFLFEPVIGSSAGASMPPPGYFEAVSTVCRQHGILMIADEVLCGMGRTGTLFASEHFHLEPDLLVLGKGLGGGYAPLSAVLVRDAHVQELKQGSGSFMHAQTYLQAPMMTAAGVAVLAYFDRHGVLDNAARVGARLQRKLRDEVLPLDHVGHVAGVGMLAGVELVLDKATKKPFDRAQKKAEGFVQHCFDHGLIVWPNTGQADGINGDLVMIGPALTCTDAQIDELVAALHANLRSYFGRLS